MTAERRLLAQEVFPTLRQRCIQLGVHLIEVDFAWGVSEKVAESKAGIMSRLLEMRQNVRTYIIGLVGERYGFTYLHDSSPAEGSLDPLYVSKRPTVMGLQEVELDEGALSDIPHKAFYYFRDPRYLELIEESQHRKGFQSEGLLARERLSNMKTRLEMEGVPVRHNYASPEDVANRILQDLTEQIALDFPQDFDGKQMGLIDSHMTREFEESCLATFQGREDVMDIMDERVLSLRTFPTPLLVVGPAGIGKTALMVAWSRRFEKNHGDEIGFFFKHYAGLNNENGCWAHTVRRALDGVKTAFGLRKKVTPVLEHLAGSFSSWMHIIDLLEERAVLMIDALDCVRHVHMEPKRKELEDPDEEEAARLKRIKMEQQFTPLIENPLDWIPTKMSTSVRFVCSAEEGSDAHVRLVSRGWNTVRVAELAISDREYIIDKWMSGRGLTADKDVKARIVGRHQSGSPFFLTQLLRGCQTPGDLKPSGSIGTSLYCTTTRELVRVVLDTLERETDMVGLTEDLMCFIAVSRRGLSEYELCNILQVPRARFSRYYLACRSILQVHFGLLSFSHRLFVDEITSRYRTLTDVNIDIRYRLAQYFLSRPLTHRTVEEAPWQLYQVRKWKELCDTIMNPEFFMPLSSNPNGFFDLIYYWTALIDPHQGDTNPVHKSEDCLRQARDYAIPPLEVVDLHIRLGEMLQALGFYDLAVSMQRRARDLEERIHGLSPLRRVEFLLLEVHVLLDKQEYELARRTYGSIVKLLTDIVDVDKDGVLTYEELKSSSAGTLLLDTEEELMFMLWQAGAMDGLEEMCLVMLGREEDRPTNELVLLDMLLHTHVERNHLDKADSFLRKCINTVPDPVSKEYVHSVGRLVALLVYRDSFAEAVALFEEAADWMPAACLKPRYEGGTGFQSVTMRDAVGMYCLALCHVGRADEAAEWLEKAVAIQYDPRDDVDSDSSSSDDDSWEEGSDVGGSDDANSDGFEKLEGFGKWDEDVIEDDAEVKDAIIGDAMLLDLFGLAMRRMSKERDAVQMHIKALKIKVLASGANDEGVAFTVSEIASCYENMRRREDSYRMRDACTVLMHGIAGGAGLTYFKALHAQAACFWKFGDYGQGAQLAEKAVFAVQSRYGAKHAMAAPLLVVLGLCKTGMGPDHFMAAEDAFVRAAGISGGIWGPYHSDTQDASVGLALLYELRGSYELSEVSHSSSRENRLDFLGEWHHLSHQDVINVALLYLRIEAYVEAEEILRQSLPGIQSSVGPESLQMACALGLLAVLYSRPEKELNNPVDAVASALRALRIREAVFGNDSPALIQHILYTALLLEHNKFFKEAFELYNASYVWMTEGETAPHGLRKQIWGKLKTCHQLGFPPHQRPRLQPWVETYKKLPKANDERLKFGGGGDGSAGVAAFHINRLRRMSSFGRVGSFGGSLTSSSTNIDPSYHGEDMRRGSETSQPSASSFRRGSSVASNMTFAGSNMMLSSEGPSLSTLMTRAKFQGTIDVNAANEALAISRSALYPGPCAQMTRCNTPIDSHCTINTKIGMLACTDF